MKESIRDNILGIATLMLHMVFGLIPSMVIEAILRMYDVPGTTKWSFLHIYALYIVVRLLFPKILNPRPADVPPPSMNDAVNSSLSVLVRKFAGTMVLWGTATIIHAIFN